jgi:hypothetical protein
MLIRKTCCSYQRLTCQLINLSTYKLYELVNFSQHLSNSIRHISVISAELSLVLFSYLLLVTSYTFTVVNNKASHCMESHRCFAYHNNAALYRNNAKRMASLVKLIVTNTNIKIFSNFYSFISRTAYEMAFLSPSLTTS